MSVTEPAPNGTTTVTRWVGQLCADAGAARPTETAAAAAAVSAHFQSPFMVSSSVSGLLLLSDGRLFGERRRPGFRPCRALRHDLVETFTKVLQHHGSGIPPRSAGNRAARMRRGTGLIEPRDRHAVLRPARR